MKITIAYQEHERYDAENDAEYFKKRYRFVTIKKSVRHDPFRHIYLTIKIPPPT